METDREGVFNMKLLTALCVRCGLALIIEETNNTEKQKTFTPHLTELLIMQKKREK